MASMIEILSRRHLLGVREITGSVYHSHKIVKAIEKRKYGGKKFTVSQNPYGQDTRVRRSVTMVEEGKERQEH